MRFCPRSYQTECIERIKSQPKVGLWLAMGMGKTVITLTAIKDLLEDLAISRVLVIAPKTVAETVWTTEAQKWDHLTGLRVERVLGPLRARRAALSAEADIWVINRENVAWLVSEGCWRWDMVVIDELSSFKSHQSKRFKALRSVLNQVHRLVGLTGTPSPNGLMDLWAQTYLLDRGQRLGKTMTAYRERFFRPGRQNGYVVYDWQPREGAKERIEELLSDLYVSMDKPLGVERVDVDRLVEIDRKRYDELKKAMTMELDSGVEITALSAATLMNKLLQLAGGSVYDEGHHWHETDRAKLDALTEVLEEADDHVLLYYRFQADRDRILAEHPEAVLLEGAREVEAWNRGEIKVLLAHPASAGYGLNLQQGGSIIVWYGLPWSLELWEQANARLIRPGQQRTVRVVSLLAAGTVDEKVKAALERKSMTQRELLEAMR